jgi:bifunctional ADP-heptose synthase (sugar kinase/adenylyltransferase)
MRSGDAEPVREPSIEVDAVDPTGAGDVFDAAFVYGMLAGWSLPHALRFGNLCAGLSVRHHGGSLASPDWDAVAAWVHTRPDDAARYRFLRTLIGGEQGEDVARGTASVGSHRGGVSP